MKILRISKEGWNSEVEVQLSSESEIAEAVVARAIQRRLETDDCGSSEDWIIETVEEED